MTTFVGRDLELAKLKELARLNVPSLVVVKGRRRVGKSRLATEFAARLSGYRSILITGMAPASISTSRWTNCPCVIAPRFWRPDINFSQAMRNSRFWQ